MAEVVGIEDMRKAVEELSSDLRRKVVRAAIRDALKPVLQRARGLVAVRTGFLLSRIAVRNSKIFNGRDGTIGGYVGVPSRKRMRGRLPRLTITGSNPYYYKFLEQGTRKMKARPFLRPAGQMLHESLEIFQARLKERIDKANRRT